MATGRMMDVIEAVYRLDQAEESWLDDLSRSAAPMLDAGLGISAYLVRQGPRGTELLRYVQTADDAPLERAARAMIEGTPPFAAEIFYETPLGCSGSVEMAGDAAREHFRRLGADVGVKDLLGIVGIGEPGTAITLAAPQREEITVHPRTRSRWNRVAAHLAASLRLRMRLGGVKTLDDAEAILDPDGRVVHASGEATEQSPRDILKRRVLEIDRARGPRRNDDDGALELWRALCAGTWSLIESFDSDGRRFMVACRNAPVTAPDRALTAREQQVVGFAALGHGDALIAYALDLAEETVRTHVRTAMGKLGVQSRLDLIRLVHALARREPQ